MCVMINVIPCAVSTPFFVFSKPAAIHVHVFRAKRGYPLLVTFSWWLPTGTTEGHVPGRPELRAPASVGQSATNQNMGEL